MKKHIDLLAILHIAFGILAIAIGLALMFLLTGTGVLAFIADRTGGGRTAFAILNAISAFVGFLALLIGLPGLIAGIGLFRLKEWARLLTLVLSAFNLFNVPFGTALAVYAFWVLLNDESIRLFMGSPPARKSDPEYPSLEAPERQT